MGSKLKVGIVGATGMVGQRFVTLLVPPPEGPGMTKLRCI